MDLRWCANLRLPPGALGGLRPDQVRLV